MTEAESIPNHQVENWLNLTVSNVQSFRLVSQSASFCCQRKETLSWLDRTENVNPNITQAARMKFSCRRRLGFDILGDRVRSLYANKSSPHHYLGIEAGSSAGMPDAISLSRCQTGQTVNPGRTAPYPAIAAVPPVWLLPVANQNQVKLWHWAL